MDINVLLGVIAGLLTVLQVIIGYCVTQHRSDHNKLKQDHHDHKLTVSEFYARKTDLNEARREQSESLKRVYDKIEAVDKNLGSEIAEIPDKVLRLLERGK